MDCLLICLGLSPDLPFGTCVNLNIYLTFLPQFIHVYAGYSHTIQVIAKYLRLTRNTGDKEKALSLLHSKLSWGNLWVGGGWDGGDYKRKSNMLWHQWGGMDRSYMGLAVPEQDERPSREGHE